MDKSNQIILSGIACYDNKGCEAIIRGTTKILDTAFDNKLGYVVETRVGNDREFTEQVAREYDPKIKHIKFTHYTRTFRDKFTPATIAEKLFQKAGIYGVPNNLPRKLRCHLELMDYLKDTKACLCVGGDNYSLDYGIPGFFTDFDDIIHEYKKPCIIWGASVGPFSKNPAYGKYMARHLKQKITAIFAREDETVQYLDSIGIRDNVYRVSDPAFLMEPMKPADFDMLGNIEGAVGLNLSPLMHKFWADNNIDEWRRFSAELLTAIVKKTDKPVYLVPHVVHPGRHSDHEFLKSVRESLEEGSERVYLLRPDYTAAEVKYIISKLSVFIGARTHSTIAAFSTLVPTISLAYSIKALGINKEVYGDLQYCVTRENKDVNYIVELINATMADRENVINKMRGNIETIKARALSAGEVLKRII